MSNSSRVPRRPYPVFEDGSLAQRIIAIECRDPRLKFSFAGRLYAQRGAIDRAPSYAYRSTFSAVAGYPSSTDFSDLVA